MSKKKEYWWVSVGGHHCEPAIVVSAVNGQRQIFTFGCKDALTTENAELVELMEEAPPTPKEAERARIAWEKKLADDKRRGIPHGYRQF